MDQLSPGPSADAHIKRFVEVERDWRLELLHGFAFKTDKDGNGIPMLFDSDTPSFDPGESAPEAKLGVLHYLGTEKPWRNEMVLLTGYISTLAHP